jgi:RNA 3'-terminal phosphate cyclase
MNRRVGRQMLRAAQEALASQPVPYISVEEARVRSPGPGSGLFLSIHFEHVTAGFEAISYQGMAAAQVVEDAIAAFDSYFWSDAAFGPELARAMMLPLALHGQPSTFTTSEITLPMRVLEFLIPRFLPINVTVSKQPKGGMVEFAPA